MGKIIWTPIPWNLMRLKITLRSVTWGGLRVSSKKGNCDGACQVFDGLVKAVKFLVTL